MPASTPTSRDEEPVMSDPDEAPTPQKPTTMQDIPSPLAPATPPDASQSGPEFEPAPRVQIFPPADVIALQKTGWLVLRSTAANFNTLLTNAGVKGVKVRQLYACEPSTKHRIHALILFYKWSSDRGDRVKWNPENSASMFATPTSRTIQEDSAPQSTEDIMFCNQALDNASATQALITAVMNIVDGEGNKRVIYKDEADDPVTDFDLGERINHLKCFLKPLDPILRSAALCSSEVVRSAHNDAARAQAGGHPELLDEEGRLLSSTFSDELWMYSIYLPGIGDRWIYEMEGVADSAEVLGRCDPELGERWTDLPFAKVGEKIESFRQHRTPFMLFSLTTDTLRSPSPKIPRKGRGRDSSTSGSKEREGNWDEASDHENNDVSADEGDGPKEADDTMKVGEEVDRIRGTHNYEAFFVEMLKLMASRGDINELIREAVSAEDSDGDEYMY